MEPSGVEYVGAAGHFISALMQIAGLFAQSAIIDHMGEAIRDLGMLFYVFSCIVALISVALFGGYRKAAYLLIGPALFYFMLYTRVEIKGGTPVRLGAYEKTNSISHQKAFFNNTRYMLSDEAELGTPKVSWFFVLYDDMITQVVQNITGILLSEELGRHLIASGKERVYSHLNLLKSVNAGFINLLVKGISGRCAEATRIGQELKAETWELGSDTYNAKKDLRDKILKEKTISLNQDHDIVEYLKIISPDDAKKYKDFKDPVSCQDVWDLTFNAAKNEAKNVREEILSGEGVAKGSPEIPWEEVWNELEASASDSPEDMNKLIAAIMIRNTLKYSQLSPILSAMQKRADYNQASFSGRFLFLSELEAKSHYGKLMYFSSVIPYFQGILLYMLTMVYPFFCLFLIIPGRATSFFVWLSLWLWVKSWDVGFGIVYSIKGILQHYLFGGLKDSIYKPSVAGSPVPIDFSDPTSIEDMMSMSDPLANEGAYMFIIAMLTCSVPIITGHLCAGASNLFSFLNLSINKRTKRVYSDLRAKHSRTIATKINYENKANMLRYVNNRVKEAEKNPGFAISANRDPKTAASNPFIKIARNKTGDYTHARRLGAVASAARFEYLMSDSYATRHAMLASLTGRRMTFTTPGQTLASSMVGNSILEQAYGRTFGSNHYLSSPLDGANKLSRGKDEGVYKEPASLMWGSD